MEQIYKEQRETSETLLVRADSVVRFRPLFIKKHEKAEDSWLVGYEPADITVALPTIGTLAIQKLQEGASVAKAREALLHQFQEDIDVLDLVQALAEVGLVESIDGHFLEEPRAIGQSWLDHIPISSISWLYSLPALSFFTTLILAGFLLFLLIPDTRAHASDLLWTPSYLIDIVSLCIIFPLLGILHELSHLLAARTKNLRGEVILSYRLFYVVFVSRIAGIWKLPQRQRLLIYCAGMGNDCLIAGILVLILFANADHVLDISAEIKALIKFIITYEYINVLWQLQICVKTDMDHIFVDLTDRHDLIDKTRLFIINIKKIFFQMKKTNTLNTNELDPLAREKHDWLAISYTMLYILGISGSCIWLLIYLIPASILAITGEYTQLLSSFHENNLLGVVDALLSLILEGSSIIILGYLWLKDYLKRKSMKSNTRIKIEEL